MGNQRHCHFAIADALELAAADSAKNNFLHIELFLLLLSGMHEMSWKMEWNNVGICWNLVLSNESTFSKIAGDFICCE